MGSRERHRIGGRIRDAGRLAIAIAAALRVVLPFALVFGPLAIGLMLLIRLELALALLTGAVFGIVVGWPVVSWLIPAPGLHAVMGVAAPFVGAIFVWPLWRAIHRPDEPALRRSIRIGVITFLLLVAAFLVMPRFL